MESGVSLISGNVACKSLDEGVIINFVLIVIVIVIFKFDMKNDSSIKRKKPITYVMGRRIISTCKGRHL